MDAQLVWLDWTLSPLQAAYFAASDSVRCALDEPLAVFAIADRVLDSHHKKSVLESPAVGGNDNVAAQLGVLCKHDWACRDYWSPAYDVPEIDGNPVVTGVMSSRFVRFELPAGHAANLLHELERRGVDGATAFPGPSGFARRASDRAYVANWIAAGHAQADIPERDDS